jgi:hypothetical protein
MPWNMLRIAIIYDATSPYDVRVERDRSLCAGRCSIQHLHRKRRPQEPETARPEDRSTICTWPSRLTFTGMNRDGSISGIHTCPDRPTHISSPTLSNPTHTKWFNTVAFVAQAANTLGNERRNQLSGLPQRALNFLVFKTFPIRESMSLQLRAEMIFRIANLFGQWHTSLTRTL